MESSDAPALSRGLEILALLSAAPELTLDAIARRLKHPKSTLHRLLEVLVATGYVEKSPEKTYRPRVTLTRVLERPLDVRITALFAAITEAPGVTAEFYVPTNEGLVLARQSFPREGEVRVVARLGFVRAWCGELDAVARVGRAFVTPALPTAGRHWTYGPGATRRRLPAAEARALINAAREHGGACDAHLNERGVRRCAAPIFAERRFAGVVATATSTPPRARDAADRHSLAHLRRLLSSHP